MPQRHKYAECYGRFDEMVDAVPDPLPPEAEQVVSSDDEWVVADEEAEGTLDEATERPA